MAATLWVPLIDRRQSALLEELLKLREARRPDIDRFAAFRHERVIGLLRGAAQGRSLRDV